MIGDAAWAPLNAALKKNDPACQADKRFVLDDLSPVDVSEMKAICRACLVKLACFDYARAAKPTGGFWAGKQHRASSKQQSGERR